MRHRPPSSRPPASGPGPVADGMGEVLFEIQVIGTSARVAAIHVATATEVLVVCPATLTRFSMQQQALRKLRRVLEGKGLLAPRA